MQRRLTRTATCKGAAAITPNAHVPIFLRNEWFSLFDQYIRHSDGATRYLSLCNSSGIEAQLPVYEEMSGGIRELRSLTNFYSPFFQLIGDGVLNADDHHAFVQRFKRYLTRFDRIDLVPLMERDAFYWKRAFAGLGFRGFIYSYSTNWYQDGIAGLNSYWAARPSRLLNTIKKKTDKLARQHGFTVGIVDPKNKLELWRYLGHYHQVYFSSWKQAEPYPAFIDAIAEYAWARGELRMGMAYHEGIPVAAQIWFVCSGTAYIFKLAYCPSYARFSVGTILSKALFDFVIANDKVTCIDYLTGNDRYKADWLSKKRNLYGIQLCNSNTLRGSIYALGNSLSDARKHVTREITKVFQTDSTIGRD